MMMLRFAVIAVATLLSGCVAADVREPQGKLQLVDLTDDFTQHWERTAELDDAARVRTFKAHFAKVLPGFYSHERFGAGPERYDARLLKELKRYAEERPGIEEVSRRFATMLEPARKSFEAHFGPMTGYPPIYLVHSLGEFDGGTRDLPEGERLLFGADLIHRLYKERDAQPFFHHELFHLLHTRTFDECEPVWCSLWKEGLATYVASKLNPKATDDELLLTWPTPLRPAVERNRPLAICTIGNKLESTDPGDFKGLFSNGPVAQGLPSRFGYYVGYLVAAEAGKTRSLQQMAQLRKEEVRPLVESTLRALATC